MEKAKGKGLGREKGGEQLARAVAAGAVLRGHIVPTTSRSTATRSITCQPLPATAIMPHAQPAIPPLNGQDPYPPWVPPCDDS